MTLLPLANQAVEITSHVVKSEERERVALLDRRPSQPGVVVPFCSWCNRVHLGGDEWGEVEEGLTRLPVFRSSFHPELKLSVCGTCHANVTRAVNNASRYPADS